MKKLLLLLFIVTLSFCGFAQKIKLVEGNDGVLKGQTALNFEFTYDNVRVGKYSDEKEYIADKKAAYNKKEPGKGDKWEQDWFKDRQARYEPRFIESFTAAIMTSKSDAEYTLIFNTSFVEPGYNIGISRQNAYIDGTATLVATSDKSKVVAKWTIDNAPGSLGFSGMDFDTGVRITECYATAGKRLGRLVAKDLGK